MYNLCRTFQLLIRKFHMLALNGTLYTKLCFRCVVIDTQGILRCHVIVNYPSIVVFCKVVCDNSVVQNTRMRHFAPQQLNGLFFLGNAIPHGHFQKPVKKETKNLPPCKWHTCATVLHRRNSSHSHLGLPTVVLLPLNRIYQKSSQK